jgi:polyhydroxybutyrate depolymerase
LGIAVVIVAGLAACTRARGAQATSAAGETTIHDGTPIPAVAGEYVVDLASGGVMRSARLHLPPAVTGGAALPLVISLHGYNSNAAQQERVSQMSAKADAAGFVAAYPEGINNPQEWRFGPGPGAQQDVAFIRDLIGLIERSVTIDPKRIYVTGISNGAEMSYRLACDLADEVAAFAPVAGGYLTAMDCRPSRPVPVVAFHGTADNLLPYTGMPPLLEPVHAWAESWAQRNGCGAQAKVIYQQGDVTGEEWSGCRDGADVVLYTIAGKGHSWPGSAMPAAITTQDISATDAMWEFFAAHPMP